ncbi:choline kinase [Acrodontium crateriforme]|uniref:Choline kinase n=1 Tax=Acrodontium crateriforme TaxID=150365 RepID=A0AAQ3M9K8_9PEZI|nr:choline kinase [Acrodontium crateriforme]
MPSSRSSASRPPSILKQESQENTSPTSYFATSYAVSPRATPKSVSISNQTEVISPLMLGKEKNVDELNLDSGRSSRPSQFKAPGARRLSGRLSVSGPSPVLTGVDKKRPTGDDDDATEYQDNNANDGGQYDSLVDRIALWIESEKAKRAKRKASKDQPSSKNEIRKELQDLTNDTDASNKRRASDASEGPDLDGLENIIKNSLVLDRPLNRKHSTRSLHHRLSLKKLQRKHSTVSSDTDHPDNEMAVPSSDAILDNSNTLAYTGGHSESEDADESDLKRSASSRDLDAWAKFKFEILRLVHTLRLKGWRKVPLDMSNTITVQRLSGALTNAVYVVSPPSKLPPREKSEGENATPVPRRPPPKLLLRIYGPQVDHLIDREAELAILRRLGRKKIGPRMLGTFANGRFEEYFHAKPLTPEELRNPDTSRQIAKRMRELHEGVDLLEKERDDGAFVWRNWDKWVFRVQQVVSWLDSQVVDLPAGFKPVGKDAWKRRGHICGVPWKQFRETVENYRAWLDAQYGGTEHVREQLVFAHNDTQYGNILRMMPTGESPLLLPANTHKQLVVIDFEYSSANVRGLEFANHFTEWCYNYHDARKPYACNTACYPTLEEQDRFIRAYIRHRPQFNISTPKLEAQTAPPPPTDNRPRPTTNISDFMLDARKPQSSTSTPTLPSTPSTPAPPTTQTPAPLADPVQQAREDAEVKRLMHETRLWRLANTTQWVAWGIVQAKVHGMPDFAHSASATKMETGLQEDLGERAEIYRELAGDQNPDEAVLDTDEDEQEEEFDYLGYAQHRAMFFWGDAVQLGLVKLEDLPDAVKEKIKMVPH